MEYLDEKVEKLFDLRVSSSGADMDVRIGKGVLTTDGEDWIKLRKSIEDLIKQSNLDLLKRLEDEKVLFYIDDSVYPKATHGIDLSAITREREKIEKGE